MDSLCSVCHSHPPVHFDDCHEDYLQVGDSAVFSCEITGEYVLDEGFQQCQSVSCVNASRDLLTGFAYEHLPIPMYSPDPPTWLSSCAPDYLYAGTANFSYSCEITGNYTFDFGNATCSPVACREPGRVFLDWRDEGMAGFLSGFELSEKLLGRTLPYLSTDDAVLLNLCEDGYHRNGTRGTSTAVKCGIDEQYWVQSGDVFCNPVPCPVNSVGPGAGGTCVCVCVCVCRDV